MQVVEHIMPPKVNPTETINAAPNASQYEPPANNCCDHSVVSLKWKIIIVVAFLTIGMVMLIGGIIYMNYEPCDEGYTGDECKLCSTGYHRGKNGLCIEGECEPHGTLGPDSVCSCDAHFTGYKCDLCERGYSGLLCDSCEKGFVMNDLGNCEEGECNMIGTRLQEANGLCSCNNGYLGLKCDTCDEGHSKNNQTCEKAECNIQGTYLKKVSGECVCKQGYAEAKCDQCAKGYVMDLDNQCNEGKCDVEGTVEQKSSGHCLCKVGYAKPHCDKCDLGYMGGFCDKCVSGYYKNGNFCVECECVFDHTIDGTCNSVNGSCNCTGNFAGPKCESCKDGFTGPDCNACGFSAHLDENICKEGGCDTTGTAERQSNGKCICKKGFTNAKCDGCDYGFTGENCDNCIAGYFVNNGTCQTCDCNPAASDSTCDSSGQCTCHGNYAGLQCDECLARYSGDNCENCASGYFLNLYEECQVGFCNNIGTQARTKKGKCICDNKHTGAQCDFCAHPYEGMRCDQCKENFRMDKESGKCLSCDCPPERSTEKCNRLGQCECLQQNFGGVKCDECNEGYTGNACDKCGWGFHMDKDNGTCQFGDCDFYHTEKRDGDGTCVCQVGFSGSRCKDCDNGYLGENCDACQVPGYYKDGSVCRYGNCTETGTLEQEPSGKCKCKPGSTGAACDQCQVGYTGVDCDQCVNGYHIDGNQCVEGDCAPYGTQENNDGVCTCKTSFAGFLCDRCNDGYHRDENTCLLGGCNENGTDHRATSGACICKTTHVGLQCDTCAVGYEGSYCELCVAGYYKDNGVCKEGECYSQGTLEQESDGTCTCNPGYIRVQCDYCHPDYHRDGDHCKALSCNQEGTKKRYANGTCECFFHFVGPRCDQCTNGYQGDSCDQCATEYHKEEDRCSLGQCDPEGTDTRTMEGACLCKIGYSGFSCNKCENGHYGPSCEFCESGTTKYNGGSCRGTKVLIATGDPAKEGKKVHVYDMKNKNWICELEDFPTNLRLPFGAFVGNTPLICGGTGMTLVSAQSPCYVYREQKWTELLHLYYPRAFGPPTGFTKDNQSMLVMGGKSFGGLYIFESEWVHLNGTSEMADGFEIPRQAYGGDVIIIDIESKSKPKQGSILDLDTWAIGLLGGCIVTLDENTFMHTGGGKDGYSDSIIGTDNTYYYYVNNTNGVRSDGPDMKIRRMAHACTKAIVGGQSVVFVAGGIDNDYATTLTAVEYLLHKKAGAAWYLTKNLPRANRYAHIVTSLDGKAHYLTGGQDYRGFLEMVCQNDDYKNCEFVDIEIEDVRADVGIAGSAAMTVPESWVEQNCM